MTQRILASAILSISCAFAVLAAQSGSSDAQELYRDRRWFELRDALTPASPPLLRATVANAFNDQATAERLLRNIVKSNPRSDGANDAFDTLSQLYIRTGRYARFIETYREWRAAFPASPEMAREAENEDKFRGRPDQKNGPVRRANLRHEEDDFSLPVTVNGKGGDYLFDTGAWQSAMTELEAKRLGLTLREGNHMTTGSSGIRTTFRTAVAREVVIGGMRFNDVSFEVFAAPSWAPDLEIGIIGMPILIHLGSLRWTGDGTIEIGAPLPSPPSPNLVFHQHRLLMRADFQGTRGLAILDTGATTTDFNANFAAAFADLLARDGTKGTSDINGVGGTQIFEAVTLPEFTVTIGSRAVALKPATVTIQKMPMMGGDCCFGNGGQDLLKQGRGFAIDFGAMTLQLF